MELNDFKASVLPLRDKLFRFARRLTNNDGEAEDIAQDVVVKLWNRRYDLTKYRSTEALAMVMTKNMSLDYLKSKRSKSSPLEKAYSLANSENPESIAERSDAVDKLKQVLNTLPEQQRMVLHLRDIEQMEFDEIEEITKMNVNAIRVNLSRARKALREKLLKIERDEFAKS